MRQPAVIRDEALQLVTDGQGGGQVDRIQRPELRRLEAGGRRQDPVIDVNESETGEEAARAPSLGRAEPGTSERARNLHQRQGARYAFGPEAKEVEEGTRFGLADDELHERRSVEVDDTHRDSRRDLARA